MILPNVVEIQVTARNLTGPEFEQVRRDAKSIGEATGKEFTAGLGKSVHEEIPGQLTLPFQDAGKQAGEKAGDQASQGLFETLKRRSGETIQVPLTEAGKKAGDPAGTAAGDAFLGSMKQRIRDGGPPSIGDPLTKAGGDGGKKGGEAAGQQFGGAMSPLILSAIAGVALMGPPLIAGGIAAGVALGGAYILKSNQDIQAKYKTLATNVTAQIKDAVSPLGPAIQGSLMQADTAITGMGPTLKKIFTDVEPDVATLTTGITSLVGRMLPGIESGLASSRGNVAAFSTSLGTLGGGVGTFFANVMKDSQGAQQGITSVIGTISTALGTLGKVVNTTATAVGADFAAISPALNGTLGLIGKVSNPVTVNGLLGFGAALKLDPLIATGLTKAAGGLMTVADKAAVAGGVAGKFSGALAGTAQAAESSGLALSGPWGLALGASAGLLSGLIEKSHQAASSISDFTGAVAKDGGVLGDYTTATIAQMLQSDKLATVTDKAGLSLADLTGYVEKNKDATVKVTTALAGQGFAGTVVKSTLDQMIGSVSGAVKQQQDLAKATTTVTTATQQFQNQLKTAQTTLATNADATAVNTIAGLNLGDANTTLNQSLVALQDGYTLAKNAGSDYGLVLSALNDDTTTLLKSEATFTTQLDTLTKVVKGQTDSLDVNNSVGAKNITTITNIAKAAANAAQATYQNELQTKGADQAYTDANRSLATMKQRFIDAADKAGYNKQQVQALANELFKLPTNLTTTVGVVVDTTRARNGVVDLIRYIDAQTGVVQMQITGPSSGITGGGRKFNAHGGIIGGAATGGARGSFTWVGEQGPELVQLPFGSTVHSNPDSQRMLAAGGSDSGPLELQVVFAGNTNSAFATAFMYLVRTGAIKLTAGGVPVKTG